ncbi:hypothetical protein M885DRAFT_45986 [Pelagophyceae sp. CCMP2097]|nr:hypothetical protein M885DRAFT_45986 [Pelagophyceae sp. CCMP2097]
MATSGKFWVLTVPNEGSSSDATFERLRSATNDVAKGSLVQIPSLTVGTLDSLMALSDDMEKIDSAVETAVRKIERQYAEIAGHAVAAREPLLIDAVPVERYLPAFAWEHAKYPHRRPLPELVAGLQQGVGAIEDELKQLTATFADKTQKLALMNKGALSRKKGDGRANLATVSLDEVLTPDVVAKIALVESEYLTTLLVAVPKSKEADWIANYASFAGGSITGATPGAAACSPAVPGSSAKVLVDGDQALWTVTLLKGHQASGAFVAGGAHFETPAFVDFVEAYTSAAKDKGFTVRKFEYDEARVERGDAERAELTADVQRLHASIVRWCKTHFAEAFVAWVHLKVVRAFVESVLRYGLPVDFITTMLLPFRNREIGTQKALDTMLAHMKSAAVAPVDEEEEGEKYHPYVIQKCTALWSAVN